MDADLRYELALSILNNMVGISFYDLEAARKEGADGVEVARLKEVCASVYVRRDSLARAGEGEWQTVIDELGPVVQGRVNRLRQTAE